MNHSGQPNMAKRRRLSMKMDPSSVSTPRTRRQQQAVPLLTSQPQSPTCDAAMLARVRVNWLIFIVLINFGLEHGYGYDYYVSYIC